MDAFTAQLAEKNAALVARYLQHADDIAWIQHQLREQGAEDEWVADTGYIFRMLRVSALPSMYPCSFPFQKHNYTRDRALHAVLAALDHQPPAAGPSTSTAPLIHILDSPGPHLLCLCALSSIPDDPETLKRSVLDACERVRDALAHRPPERGLQFVLVLDVRGAKVAPSLAYELVPWYVREAHARFPGACGAVLVQGYGWAHAGVWAVVRRLLPQSAVTRVLFPDEAELAAFLAANTPPPPRIDTDVVASTSIKSPHSHSPLAPRHPLNPTYGYPYTPHAPSARRRKRDLARTLLHLWLVRWRKRLAAWTGFALIWALLVLLRRGRVPVAVQL
ncbi:hypothetical protein AURDEDRAFT_150123 [Auricularia subglabra TFB-10046 SS5]|nr:hypothetical protein AURDEDRAFT_150123 [Auricularia subglabra TFB-10046 SS5]